MSDVPEATVPEMLRAARKGAGLTQRDLAKRLGVSQQAITGWETGDRKIGGEQLARFLQACDAPESSYLTLRVVATSTSLGAITRITSIM